HRCPPKTPDPLPPGCGGLTREARGSAPRAWGEEEWLAERRRQAGACSRREKERTGGRSGRGRERRCGDPSRSARPTPRGSAGLPRLRLLRSAPPRRPPPQHASHSRARRGPSFVATTSAVRRARARALAGTGADGGNEAKAGPPARKRLWLGEEQSRRRARRARAPLRPYLPCRGSSQIPGDGARPFLRTHWARGSETHPLPSPGHAFSRGSRGDGPSGQQIVNSTTYVGSSFLFLLKHGTVVRARGYN
uniref:Uncharacterized protein n=1 Tax=Mustela putorius furo TaxID=9669 RepID=M3YFB0_MUSPF